METIALVLPEDGGPKISVIAPRGRPPVRASSGAIPVGTLSKTRLSRSAARRTTDCINVIEDQFLYTEHLYGMSMVTPMPRHSQQTAAPLIPSKPTISKLRAAAARCKACDLWKLGTQTVF